MISDKPRRFKPSDCVTPVDPVTNSFMGSVRDNRTNVTTKRLQEHNTTGQISKNAFEMSSFGHPTNKMIPDKPISIPKASLTGFSND